jgi:hypothetical protein
MENRYGPAKGIGTAYSVTIVFLILFWALDA